MGYIKNLEFIYKETIDHYEYKNDGFSGKIRVNRSQMTYQYDVFDVIRNKQIVFNVEEEHFMDLKSICNKIETTIADYKQFPEEYID